MTSTIGMAPQDAAERARFENEVRLEVNSPTLPLAELLLEKRQVEEVK